MSHKSGADSGAMAAMTMDSMDMDGMEIRDSAGMQFATFNRYSGWPELKEALMANKVRAAYLLAPMAMDLADKGIPVRIVALGHRSGAVIMVKKSSSAKNLGDLKGKRVAIPSRFAVDHIFVRKLMKKFNLKDSDLTLVEMPPPDMPAALYANAVDAYATGEPFGALAQREGYARVLHWTRDEWPKYICCVLVVRQELIDEDRPMVQRLVNNVLSAGTWLESDTANRHIAAELAAKPAFFNQDPLLLKFVMDNPKDRVTYGDLRLVQSELDEIMNLALEAKVITHPIPYTTYVDESFMRNYRPANINLAR